MLVTYRDVCVLLTFLSYSTHVSRANIPECTVSTFGSEYRGHVNTTISGRQCQRWDSQTPHEHTYNTSPQFPDRSIALADSYCRNPVPVDFGGLWCYTTDPGVRFEYCDVPQCSEFPECKRTESGQGYRGNKDTTTSGSTCQPWSAPDDVLVDNYCRNPDGKEGGPWCYTDPAELQWDYCGVPFCKPSASCTTTVRGEEYIGTVSTTVEGVHCQRWDDTVHHTSNYTDPADFPDVTLADAADFCRNPRGDKSRPWCYTMSPDVEWDFCEIEQCGTCRLTETGSDYAGTVSMTSSGYTCQRWDAQTPHAHNMTDPDRFPDQNLLTSSNYCRNPDGRAGGPWCYTTDPGVPSESCDIPLCTTSDEMLQPTRDVKHVVHIGIDGLHPCFVNAPAPNIMTRLADEGAWTMQGRTVLTSWSAPCWTAILCGGPSETTGITGNSWSPPWRGSPQPISPASGNDVPLQCMFDMLKRQDRNVRTAAFYLWYWLQYVMSTELTGNMDVDIYCDPTQPLAVQCDNNTASDSSAYLRDVFQSAESSYTFIYLMSVDEAGHRYTWCSDTYLNQVQIVDDFVGQILDVIDDENMRDDVMVVLTTDHGGHDFTHGTFQDSDLLVPMFFRGPGIKKNFEMEYEVKNIDVSSTIMRAMGYRRSVWWKGMSLDQIFTEDLP